MTKRLTPDPDLESLISKLNNAAQEAGEDPPFPEEEPTAVFGGGSGEGGRPRWALPPAAEEVAEHVEDLLERARRLHATDLLLVPGVPATVRVNGGLVPLGQSALDGPETAALCSGLVPPPKRPRAESHGAVDFAISRRGIGRLRCNVHRQRVGWAAAIRLLPERIPTLEQLNLPARIENFAELNHGLVLVTGPTGSGKSSTLAALSRVILARRRVHLITIEDPVEYEHPHGESVVEHVEIGRDALSFAEALRASLRQDPDVLLIGEMRDPESIGIAITAAETGHLVLSTLHTGDAAQTINRIVDSYPGSQTEVIRTQLSVSLAAIVSQQLLPRADGQGRVPAVEILLATDAARNLIRQGKIPHLRSQLTLEQTAGMLSLDASLADLATRGVVEVGEARRRRARNAAEFDQRLGRGTT